MGWQVLSASSFLGNGAVEPLGSAAGCLLSNAKADRFLAVRHSPQFNYTVYMAQVEILFLFIRNSIFLYKKGVNEKEGLKYSKKGVNEKEGLKYSNSDFLQ